MAPPRDKTTHAPDEKRSGRVAYDERGNAVWEWQVDTGVYSRDVNTQSVRKLDLEELSLAETGLHRTLQIEEPASGSQVNPARAGGGFNPYDHSPAARTATPDPYNRARVAAASAFSKPEAPTPAKKTPTDLRKLSSWIKLKRAIASKSDTEDDE